MKDEKATVTLRPCPFCGSKYVEAFTATLGTHGVRCYNCGVDVMFYGTEASAFATAMAWNRRAVGRDA